MSSDRIRRAAKVSQINMAEAEISLWATDVFENGVAVIAYCLLVNISMEDDAYP